MNEGDPTEEIEALRAVLAAERRKGEAFIELNHELRTLITGVIGLTGLLLDTELSAEQRDYVKRVRGFSDALVGLVNNVLDFSRADAGKLSLEQVDVDVRRLADEVGELSAERARARGVELVVNVAADVPAVRGDPTRLRQVLMNLVSNALKFTERGEVVLRVTVADASAEQAVLRFQVRDTGVGISPEGQARLFRPFSQVHAGEVAGAGAGSGLGLALCKQLVDAMGGEIGVSSEAGRGSTFSFTVALETRRAGTDRNAIPRVDMAGRRVLAAVGNASARENLAEMLTPLGVTVHAAADAEASLAFLHERRAAPFALVLLDAALPGAASLMRALDGEEALAALPIILLAYPGQRWEDREAADPRSPITMSGSGRHPTWGASDGAGSGRTGSRPAKRAVTALAKPVRQAHLHACLFKLMGSAVEDLAPESRRAPLSRRTGPLRPATPSAGVTRPDPPRPPPTSAASPASPARGQGDRPCVLLVEDNAVNQRVARMMMEKRGYEVDVAGDGYEAVEATGRAVYAAVLMDCHMPRLDGYSATLEIRTRDAQRRRVPIIAMTANSGPGARERCLAAGMDDYIAKPVTAEAIDEVLRRWVPRAAPAPPPAKPRTSSSPVVDLGMLRKLRTTQSHGEPDIVTEVIALFLQDAPARVAAIHEGVARGDLAGAARTAHTLKGSAGHLGAKALAGLCARFEEKVRAGSPFNVSFAVGAIADELERVRAALALEPRSGRVAGPAEGGGSLPPESA